MRKTQCVLLIVVLAFAVVAVAADKAPLSDAQLNAITAGSFGSASGAVAAGGSTVDVSKAQNIVLAGSAQSQAEAANLVNASSTKFATGLNVWAADSVQVTGVADATYKMGEVDGSIYSPIYQTNYIAQTPTVDSVAGVYGYDRGIQIAFDKLTFAATFDQTEEAKEVADSSFKLAAAFSKDVSAKLAAFVIGAPVVDTPSMKTADADDPVAAIFARFHKKVDASLDVDATAHYEASESASTNVTANLEVDGFVFNGPLTIDEARGEAVAVDGSKVTYTADASINLSDNAQAGAKAINLVNAINSLVGVGTNIAYSPQGVYSTFGIQQVNVIYQK